MNKTTKILKQICVVVTFTLAVLYLSPLKTATASEPEYKSKYIGQEKRSIKSLSKEDNS